MTIEEYQREVTRTAQEYSSFADALCFATVGLTSEAGEVAGLTHKCVWQGHDFNQEKFVSEMGDVLWYLAFLCNELGISLEAVMEQNIQKLRHRYPNGFSAESSINRPKDSTTD